MPLPGVDGVGGVGEGVGGALMSSVPAKKTYGFTCTRLGQPRPHTSSRSSMMATIESPQGNTDLRERRGQSNDDGMGKAEYFCRRDKSTL